MATTDNPGEMTSAQEWRGNWPMVVAAMTGISVAALPTVTLGLFMQPLSDEFGWSRTQISLGLSIFALVAVPLTPFAGLLVDRFGARRVAVPGVMLSGACFAAFGLMSGSYYQWIALWVAYTLASLLIKALVWGTAISTAFTKSRGLALALLLSGTALATAAGPTVARLLIAEWGWRGGYAGLGVGWAGLAALLTLFFFHETKGPVASPTTGARVAPAALLPGGLTVREAVRNPAIRRIALAAFIQTMMGAAISVHMVPLLAADGLSLAQATTLAAVVGLASIAGKLITGSLIDRFSGSFLPVVNFSGPFLTYLLLLHASGSLVLLGLATFVLGFASGASLQLCTYLTTRYAGLRNFGTIFGIVSSMMAAGAGIGPVVAGLIYDATGGYAPLLIAGMPAAVIAGLAVFRLGAYPVFAPIPAALPVGDTPLPAA